MRKILLIMITVMLFPMLVFAETYEIEDLGLEIYFDDAKWNVVRKKNMINNPYLKLKSAVFRLECCDSVTIRIIVNLLLYICLIVVFNHFFLPKYRNVLTLIHENHSEDHCHGYGFLDKHCIEGSEK